MKIFRVLLPAVLLLVATPALAQLVAMGDTARPRQECKVVPDTAAVPSARQVAERRELRASLDSMARAGGVAQPKGILFVDVDSTRRGRVLFLESNFPDEVAGRLTRRVGDYLSTLPAGRPYQALVRIDGDYPAMAPGKRHCPPVLANPDSLSAMMRRVLSRHPEAGKRTEVAVKRAVLRLVVNREGAVSFVDIDQPTGDPFLDLQVEGIAARLRFLPARLDDMPYDTRFRFNMTFRVK